MADWNADENPYDVLGLTIESSKEDQRKRYRKLVLEKHPDKQPGNKRAAEEFIKIQRAYEIINDDKAREAWTALQRAKSARETKFAWQSEKRRKMAQDLEKREAAYEAERGKEKAARDKLQAELARLKREMAEREEQRQAKLMQDQIAASFATNQAAAQSAKTNVQIQRTVKASWDLEVSNYPEEALKEIFSRYGQVEEVIPRQVKKKSKGSALIVMATDEGAQKASDSVSGSLQNPLLVVPLAKASSQASREDLASESAGQPAAWKPAGSNTISSGYIPAFPGNAPQPSKPLFAAVHSSSYIPNGLNAEANGSKASHTSLEEGVFAKIRRKAEEDRLAKAREAGQQV